MNFFFTGNTVPQLNATTSVNATGNITIQIHLLGEDQDNDEITYYTSATISGSVLLDNKTGLVEYTPNIHDPAYLRYALSLLKFLF